MGDSGMGGEVGSQIEGWKSPKLVDEGEIVREELRRADGEIYGWRHLEFTEHFEVDESEELVVYANIYNSNSENKLDLDKYLDKTFHEQPEYPSVKIIEIQELFISSHLLPPISNLDYISLKIPCSPESEFCSLSDPLRSAFILLPTILASPPYKANSITIVKVSAGSLQKRNLQICGSGAKVTGEECDDGGKVDGDGCSSTCTYEYNYVCFGTSPSVCQVNTCGDGGRAGTEQCDDKNTISGDG